MLHRGAVLASRCGPPRSLLCYRRLESGHRNGDEVIAPVAAPDDCLATIAIVRSRRPRPPFVVPKGSAAAGFGSLQWTLGAETAGHRLAGLIGGLRSVAVVDGHLRRALRSARSRARGVDDEMPVRQRRQVCVGEAAPSVAAPRLLQQRNVAAAGGRFSGEGATCESGVATGTVVIVHKSRAAGACGPVWAGACVRGVAGVQSGAGPLAVLGHLRELGAAPTRPHRDYSNHGKQQAPRRLARFDLSRRAGELTSRASA